MFYFKEQRNLIIMQKKTKYKKILSSPSTNSQANFFWLEGQNNDFIVVVHNAHKLITLLCYYSNLSFVLVFSLFICLQDFEQL